MLSKKVCKKCLDEKYGDDGWLDMDDNDWKQGVVDCPYEPVYITNEPPRECPYKLEHIILEQKN